MIGVLPVDPICLQGAESGGGWLPDGDLDVLLEQLKELDGGNSWTSNSNWRRYWNLIGESGTLS
jgi:hypothetical protein